MRHLTLALLLSWCTTSCAGPDHLRKGRDDGSPPVASEFYTERGVASWYGEDFHEKPTATGEVYDMYALTAAHRTLPLGTWVEVIDLDTQRAVEVRINDRGPFVKNRIIDLSYGAALALGIVEQGTAHVEIRCSYTEDTLREQLGYWVQLGAYHDGELAGGLALRLEQEYPNVRVLSSDKYHHVRIGPFQTEPEATQLKELLLDKGETAFVVRDLLSLSPAE